MTQLTAAERRPPRPAAPPTLAQRLFQEGFAFDFFQAVRLLEKVSPGGRPVGHGNPPDQEAVRFRAHLSLAFPPSSVYDIEPPHADLAVPRMTVTFMGLTGPNGVLPRHYTELLLRLHNELKGPERRTLRDWLDLFNHRLISLFYRAWEKYRMWIPYERESYARPEPDTFTQALFSLVGLGTGHLRNRMRVAVKEVDEDGWPRQRVVARIDDLSLLYYAGIFAHRPRCAVSLELFLEDYFRLPVKVLQFQGKWLDLGAENQSRLGGGMGFNNTLGEDLVVGDRVWDVQGKITVRLGPLTYAQFLEFLPDKTPTPSQKGYYLLTHLVRYYIGMELAYVVQLALKAEEVPPCRLPAGNAEGPQLGWTTWLFTTPRYPRDAEDCVLKGEETVWLKR
jgi:type VI secretion system protein ImpH